MLNKRSEKGQAIIMIVFAIIGLIGLTGLTVDGGRAFSDRRHAQGAVDSAAWAGGLANARAEVAWNFSEREAAIIAAAEDIVNQNGYMDDGTRSEVDVTVSALPVAPDPLPDGSPNPCPVGVSPNVEITVSIISYVQTFFAPVLGVEQVTNQVQAVARACGTYVAPIFGGNAIVSCGNNLDETQCAYNTGNSGTVYWTINNGGLFSGTCGFKSNNSTVTLTTPGKCVSAVSGVTNLEPLCPNNPAVPQCTNEYLNSIMPFDVCALDENENPVYADETELPDTVDVSKLVHLSKADLDSMATKEFKDAVFCLHDLGDTNGTNPLSGEEITLKNATLYITDKDFDLKFTGGPGATNGFSGTPTESGTFARYAIIVIRDENPCLASSGLGSSPDDQVLEYRGSSGASLYGTILAPTACIDMRGNTGNPGDTLNINSQIIANVVGSNGNATVTVTYNEGQNRQQPVYPTIMLIQ